MLLSHFIAQAGIVGFESPASQYEEASLCLSDLLITSPSSTYLSRADSHVLSRYGIFKGDILIINTSYQTAGNQLIVGELNGEPVCRLYDHVSNILRGSLSAHHVQLNDNDEFHISGVINYSIRCHLPSNTPLPSSTDSLDLDSLIVKHPSATYFGLAQGNSMINEGIFDGDILVVDRHQFVHDGAVIVATLNGEFVCKKIDKKQRALISTKPFNTYYLREHDRFQVEGCVVASIRMHKQLRKSLG